MCPHCGEAITYRKSSGGMLKYKCDECQSSGYAEPGGKAFAAMHSSIRFDKPPEPPEPEPKAAEPPPTKAAEPAKKINSVFAMGDL
jgi:hypothetical protein